MSGRMAASSILIFIEINKGNALMDLEHMESLIRAVLDDDISLQELVTGVSDAAKTVPDFEDAILANAEAAMSWYLERLSDELHGYTVLDVELRSFLGELLEIIEGRRCERDTRMFKLFLSGETCLKSGSVLAAVMEQRNSADAIQKRVIEARFTVEVCGSAVRVVVVD
jgi:hypothetical protein